MTTLEICTGCLESVIAAVEGGADRVELCSALEVGGLTPSLGYLREALRIPGIRKQVLIRPRGGDFTYNDSEISMMLNDIELCAQLGADGVVVGALTSDGHIDVEACRSFKEADTTGQMSFTFHRAFDICTSPYKAIEQLAELGYERILTSGQAPKAAEGIELLRQLQEHAQGRISIMPGSGVNVSNIAHIVSTCGVTEIHSSASWDSPLTHHAPLFDGYREATAQAVAELKAELAKLG